MNMGKVVRWGFVLFLIIVGVWVYDFFDAAGLFRNLEPKIAGVCKEVTGLGKRLLIGSIFEVKILDCSWDDALECKNLIN